MFYALVLFFCQMANYFPNPQIFPPKTGPRNRPRGLSGGTLRAKSGLRSRKSASGGFLAGPMFGEPRRRTNNDSAHRRSNRFLEHQVVAFPHAQCLVGAYSRCVSLVNVQPYLPNPFAAGNFLGGGVECPVGALTA